MKRNEPVQILVQIFVQMQYLIAVFYFSESFSASYHIVNLIINLWFRCNVSLCYQKKKRKEKFAVLVVLLNSKLYYNVFFVIVFFLPLLQDSATTWQNTNLKINFINFLFDLFGYLLNFLTMFDIYRMLMNYTLRFVFLILSIVYFISAQECTGSLSFRDAG